MEERCSGIWSQFVNIFLLLLLCGGWNLARERRGCPWGSPSWILRITTQVTRGPTHPEHGKMGNIGAKLADPTADIWAIQFNFQGPTFNDGDLNLGSPEYGGNVVIQPVMPIPLYGKGADEWKLITRPVIPIVFAQPIPTCIHATLPGNFDEFDTKGGLGDIAFEMLIAPPASATHLPKNLIIAAGLGLGFPTSTSDSLGKQQFTAGPSFALGWKTKTYTALAFPTYFFSIGDRGDRKSQARHLMSVS